MGHRVAMMALVGVLLVGACSTGESTVPGVPGADPGTTVPPSDLPETTNPATTTATTTGGTTTDTTTDTTTAVETSGPDATPTTDDPAGDAVEDACASLAGDGFETRTATMADFDGQLAEVEAACSDDYERWSEAAAIVERMDRFNAAEAPISATDLVCDGGSFSLSITNNVDHPVGVHASLRLVGTDSNGPVGSTLRPLVIWSIDPGGTAAFTEEYVVNRGPDEGLDCAVDITAFDASQTDADASSGETRVPELAVDDPAQWLPFLVAQGAAIVGSGDADLAAVVEDIRSTEYRSVIEQTQLPAGIPETGTISVCSASIEQPDDRHISLVYYDESPDSSQLQHGLFRRGNDDQWRWLSSSVYFDSQDFWDCGTPSSNL